MAFTIVEKGLADYLASDFHGHSGLKIYKKEAWDVLGSRGAADTLETLCRANPSRLIDGLDPIPVMPVPGMSGIFGKLRGMMRRDRRTSDSRTLSGEP
jgi:hypothetical protein